MHLVLNWRRYIYRVGGEVISKWRPFTLRWWSCDFDSSFLCPHTGQEQREKCQKLLQEPQSPSLLSWPLTGTFLSCSGTSHFLHQTSSKVAQETWGGSLLLFTFSWENCWEPGNYRSPPVRGLRTTTPSEVQCLLTRKWGCVSFITRRDFKAEECVYLKTSICRNIKQ